MGGHFSTPTFKSPLLETGRVKPFKVVVFGCEDADQDELLPHFGIGEPTITIPTIGISISVIEHKQLVLYGWSNRDQSRRGMRWRIIHTFIEEYDVAIFVVDAADQEGLGEAKNEMA